MDGGYRPRPAIAHRARLQSLIGAYLLLESMVRKIPVEQIGPPLKALFFYSATTASPLGLLDTQYYVVGLINMLMKVHEAIIRRQIDFVAFKLPHPSILRGQCESGSWLTLVAYCGGWRSVPVKVMCGASPLFLGKHALCPSCNHLICNFCGYCSQNCELVDDRQSEMTGESPTFEPRPRLLNQWLSPHIADDFDDDIPF